MNKDESLALYAQGRDAWNAWAQKQLDQRAEMEKAGTWAATSEGFVDGQNDATRAWLAASRANFSEHTFDEPVDFRDIQFPAYVWFDKATFTGDAVFAEARFSGTANFRGARFSGVANFRHTVFSDEAWFGDAVFSGDAEFIETTFSKEAWFLKATFEKDAQFEEASFIGPANFGKAIFSADVTLIEARFLQDAWFEKVIFAGDVGCSGAAFSKDAGFGEANFAKDAWFGQAIFTGGAGFNQACFDGHTSFQGAQFKQDALFTAMRSGSYFSLEKATFAQVPNFEQAHFAEAPRLDISEFHSNSSSNGDTTARWRALKRLAIQGHDHEREQSFFAEEIKSLRGRSDFALPRVELLLTGKPVWPGAGRYWIGVLYQVFSNFGRSMLRPLFWWGSGILVFAACYLHHHIAIMGRETGTLAWLAEWLASWAPSVTGPPPLTCIAGPGDAWSAALQLSIRKALLFAGLDSTDKLNQLYACLYGIYPASKALHGSLPDQFTPVIPDFASLLGLAQLLYSAVLLFLFLLAVRNHFRIH
jgi:uncharacterized protein YjbI with pentapeptide repeats